MKASLLARSFPAPKYISMPAAGLDISDRSIKVMNLNFKKGEIRPANFFIEEIPEGIIKNGGIENKEALEKIFKKIRSKHNINFAHVSLPEEKAYVFDLFLPIGTKDIREAVELQIEDYVPFPASNVVFDFEIIDVHEDNFLVAVSVLPSQVVMDYLEIIDRAGILALSFEVEAHSLARAVIGADTKETCMIVDFGQTRSGFTIVSNGKVRFSSTVAIGGDNVTKAVAEKFDVTQELARKMKEERGLRKTTDEELFYAITPVVSLLRDEINKFEMYWDSRKNVIPGEDQKINTIIMCGGDSNTPGLLDHISSGSETNYILGNPWVNVFDFDEYIPSLKKNEALRYATAIGLALRSYERVIND